MRTDLPLGTQRSTGLVDVLDRVLDKGLLVAGDIKVSLAEVELLTIRIRLVICSMDKAEAMGLDWWRHDRHFAPATGSHAAETAALRRQVRELEQRIAALASGGAGTRRVTARRGTSRAPSPAPPRRGG
jgi:hypothetical protein